MMLIPLQGGYPFCTKTVIALVVILTVCASLSEVAQAETPPPALTLETAISRALETAPALVEANSLEKASRADLAQAKRWQNPELAIEAENLFGNGDYKGAKNAEVTLGITQSIQLPTKRKHRLAALAGSADLGHQQADATRVDVIHAVTVAYFNTATAQQNAALTLTQLDLAESQYKTVVAKVDAGKEPPLQERKAKIDVVNARMVAQLTQQKFKTARENLQLITGISDIPPLDASFLNKIEEPLPIAEYTRQAALAPVARAATAERTTTEAQASYAGVEWLPDPALTLGVRDIREDDSQALVLGVSLPIPLAHRNKAGTLAAYERANAALAAENKTRQAVQAEIIRTHAELTLAYQALNNYKLEILPAATAAADLARRGYEAGKFQYLDMLDAGRTLADARQAENEALLAYHLNKANLEKLTGRYDHHAAEAHQ